MSLSTLKSLHERAGTSDGYERFVNAVTEAFPLLCAEVEAARAVRRLYGPDDVNGKGCGCGDCLWCQYDAARRATEGDDA